MHVEYRNAYRAALLRDHAEQVRDVDGVLCRAPQAEAELDDIVFYEPVACNLPMNTWNSIELRDHLMGAGITPFRVLSDRSANASYDYAEIVTTEHWPAHRPLRTRSNSQSVYNRICRDALVFAQPQVEIATDSRILEILADVLAHGSLADKCTIFAWLDRKETIQFAWLTLKLDGHEYATYLTGYYDGCFYSFYLILQSGARASIATWHLINHYHNLVNFNRFDIWNVALTVRENYKRAFFTAETTAHCWWHGANPYPWLHVNSTLKGLFDEN